MSLTPSTMLALNTPAIDFRLPDVTTGKQVSLKDFESKKALLVMFICQHCPYVQHIKKELAKLGRDYASKDIGIVGISSNDAEKYPDDAPEELAKFVKEAGIPFPLLHDAAQDVAKLYTAACTPDIFLFARPSSPTGSGRGRQTPGVRPSSVGSMDSPLTAAGNDASFLLVYRGQLDDSRPGNGKPANGKDLRAAMDAVLSNKWVSADQRPATGCNIKWKPGNEPDYFR